MDAIAEAAEIPDPQAGLDALLANYRTAAADMGITLLSERTVDFPDAVAVLITATLGPEMDATVSEALGTEPHAWFYQTIFIVGDLGWARVEWYSPPGDEAADTETFLRFATAFVLPEWDCPAWADECI
jgi:hypothetical protein